MKAIGFALVIAAVFSAAGCAASSGTATLRVDHPPTTTKTPGTPPSATSRPVHGTPTVTAPAYPQGSAGTASASPVIVIPPSAVATSPTPRPTHTAPVTLTESSSGETVSVRVGDQITVVLGGNGQQWDPPTAQGDAVRRTSASGGYPTAEPARATFLAVAAGSSRLSSTTDAACLHSQPRCMIAQRMWSVDVVVHR